MREGITHNLFNNELDLECIDFMDVMKIIDKQDLDKLEGLSLLVSNRDEINLDLFSKVVFLSYHLLSLYEWSDFS